MALQDDLLRQLLGALGGQSQGGGSSLFSRGGKTFAPGGGGTTFTQGGAGGQQPLTSLGGSTYARSMPSGGITGSSIFVPKSLQTEDPEDFAFAAAMQYKFQQDAARKAAGEGIAAGISDPYAQQRARQPGIIPLGMGAMHVQSPDKLRALASLSFKNPNLPGSPELYNNLARAAEERKRVREAGGEPEYHPYFDKYKNVGSSGIRGLGAHSFFMG